MTDYEEKQERKNKAKKAVAGFASVLGAVAWEIARSVIVQRGVGAANDAINNRLNKNKKE